MGGWGAAIMEGRTTSPPCTNHWPVASDQLATFSLGSLRPNWRGQEEAAEAQAESTQEEMGRAFSKKEQLHLGDRAWLGWDVWVPRRTPRVVLAPPFLWEGNAGDSPRGVTAEPRWERGSLKPRGPSAAFP